MTEETKQAAGKILDTTYEKKDNFGAFMKNYLIDLVVVMIMVVYIARNIATIGLSDKSLFGIIADSALAFFFAISVSVLMQKKGLMVGENDEKFAATLAEYSKVIDLTTPYLNGLKDFCDRRNAENLKHEQTRVLRPFGVTYEVFAAGTDDPTEAQAEAFKAAGSIRIHELTPKELVSESGEERTRYDLGPTQEEFVHKKNWTTIAMTALTSIILGWFALKLVQDFSWAALIWSCVQVVFFAVKGTISFFNAYMFMKNGYRNRIINKTAILYEFYNAQKEEQKHGRIGRIQESAEEAAGRAGSGGSDDTVVSGRVGGTEAAAETTAAGHVAADTAAIDRAAPGNGELRG